jgi:Tfp pilus assembly protein PilO
MGGIQAIVVVVVGGIFWLQSSALAQSNKTLQEKQAELNDGQRIARRREAAQANLEQARQQIHFLESGVSRAAYVPTLLKQLEDLATSTSNQVISVRPQADNSGPSKMEQRRNPDAQEESEEGGDGGDGEKQTQPEPYTRLSIQVTLVGGFESTQRFVERLTRFPKIISVEQVQIRPHRASGPAETSNSLLDVELKLTAFVMKEQPRVFSGGDLPADNQAGGIN